MTGLSHTGSSRAERIDLYYFEWNFALKQRLNICVLGGS